MIENFDKLFYENDIIYDNITKLFFFLDNIFNEYNNKIVRRFRKLDFYDLFFYMLRYNSSINETHRSSNYNFNVENDKNISENAFINRLVKLDCNYIKDINDKFINFYYTLFKIDTNNIITATDGSNIKLLASHKKDFKLNKNNYYTNAIISCVYDINNNLPLFMNINKSFNEVDNLLKQLDDDVINKYKYKIINVTDRGYDCIRLINYYLQKNICFVSRITKTNSFVNNLKKNMVNNKFTYSFENKIYELQIIKYTNIKKPEIKETKDELILQINNIKKKINLIKINILNENFEYNKLSAENKLNTKNLKLKTNNHKIINKEINKNRALKLICKKKINKLKNENDNLNKDYTNLKSKLEQLETYTHSDFYIITNNLKYSINELKDIYKKRWYVETSFKFDKTVLNLNQMNNKNIQLIKQNVYIMQFIYIMNAFINKLLEKTIKKNYSLNKTQIFNSLHDHIFSLLKKILIKKKYKIKKKIKNYTKIKLNIDKKIKKTINKLLEILKLLSKYQVKNKNDRKFIRVKKRINNNKFNNRKKNNDG